MKLTYQEDWLNAHGADELGHVWVPRDGMVLGSQARFFFLVPLCCCRVLWSLVKIWSACCTNPVTTASGTKVVYRPLNANDGTFEAAEMFKQILVLGGCEHIRRELSAA